MKKILFFLTTILIIQSSAFAQFTNSWRAFADGATYPWLSATANANNVASLAYNPATDKLLVSSRNSNVYILNAATGAQEGTLSLVGLGAESFKFNKIRVDADGVIYGISLATGATSACKIYRWANQAANPVECASFTVTERTGDSFGLSGTGANTVLYASGAATTANAFNIYILNTTDGLAFTLESKVTMTSSPTTNQQWANRVVEPVSTGVNSDIWINGGGFNARRISISPPTGGVRTGTVVTTIADGLNPGQASVGYGGMRYITGTTNKFLVFAGGNNSEAGTVMRALNVTNEAAITTHGTEALYPTSSYVTNANGSGDVSFKVNSDGSFTTFYLSTNNGIGATISAPNTLPVDLTSFTAAIKNSKNTLTWTTASESNNSGFDVESSTDGSGFNKIGFVATKAESGNSNAVLTYSFEDAKAAKGTTYYRLKQVDFNGDFKYSDVKFINNSLNNVVEFSVYPNPVTNVIRVSTPVQDLSGYQVDLYNTNGTKVKSLNLVDGNSIDVSDLSSAIYMLKVSKDKNLVQTLKLVKQ